jgi:hypothetical protein
MYKGLEYQVSNIIFEPRSPHYAPKESPLRAKFVNLCDHSLVSNLPEVNTHDHYVSERAQSEMLARVKVVSWCSA